MAAVTCCQHKIALQKDDNIKYTIKGELTREVEVNKTNNKSEGRLAWEFVLHASLTMNVITCSILIFQQVFAMTSAISPY